MAQPLELKNPCNIIWKTQSSAWVNVGGSQVIGRADNQYRIERYEFKVNTIITKLHLEFTDTPSGYIFTHGGGNDKRGQGIGFYITTDPLMQDWNFHPNNSSPRSGKLEFQDGAYNTLKGDLDLSNNPLKKDTKYYLFLYTYNVQSAWGYMWWSSSQSYNTMPNASNCAYESYTAPSVPANFGFKYPVDGKQLVKSTGFTVEWDVAQDGVNNPVTGYQLFLNGESLKIVEGKDATSYSYEFTKEQDFQGEDITVSIRTIAREKIAEYSELESIMGRVNTRPSMPDIFKNYSGNGVYMQGNITLTLVGQDLEDTAEELTYWRKNDAGEWEEVKDGTFNSSINQATTYCFKTKDSVGDYSNEKEFTIECYTETLSITEGKSVKYGDKTDVLTVSANQDCLAVAVFGAPQLNKYKLIKGKTKDIECVKDFGLGAEAEIYFYPLDSTGTPLTTGKDFPIKTISTPLMPTKEEIEVFDSFNGKNIINNLKELNFYHCFFQEVYLKIPKFDSRIKTQDLFISFVQKDTTIQKAAEYEDAKGNFFYLKATFDIAKTSDTGKLKINLGGYESIELDDDYNRIIEFPFKNLKGNYTNTPVIYQNDIAVEFARNIDTDLLKVYGLSNPVFKMDITCETGNVYGLTTTLAESEKSSYICTYSLSEGLLSGLNIDATDYFGEKLFLLIMHVKNKYGHISTNYCEQVYDFEKSAEISGISLEYQKNSNNDNSWASPSSADSFKYIEGMPIKISYTIKRWSATPTGIEIRANKSGELLKSFEDNSGNSFKGTTTLKVYEFNLSKITGSSSLWNLYLNGQSCLGQSFGTLPINDKIVTLGGFWYNDGLYTLQSDYSINREDKDTTLAHYLVIDKEEYELSKDSELEPLKFSFKSEQESRPDPMSNQDSLIGQLRIKETASAAGYSITKSWDSNTVVIYNIVPTISYRKNRVGINTSNPEADNSILYVARAGDGHNITFKVVDDEGNSNNIVIDLKTGNFTGTGGLLSSFIIDCGSWDDTPSGPIPSVPGAPSGLARIAYTGLISDLVEDENIDLILDANEFDFS